MKSLMLFCCLLTGCIVTQGGAATIKVPADYPTIQSAINAAAYSVDEVVVSPGTYYEQNINLWGKAITVRSENPLDPAATVIMSDIMYSGFIFASGESASTIVDGFTVVHAYFDFGGAFVCTFDDQSTKRGSSPTIRNCIITTNTAWTEGAGLFCDVDCSPIVENCTFMINTSGKSGGAVSISGGNPSFLNCQFLKNTSDESGGAVSIY